MREENEEQNEWNNRIRSIVCDSINSALQRICGGSYQTKSVNHSDKNEWRAFLKNLANCSVSLPNRNVCSPFHSSGNADGKPHDIEARVALKLFHHLNNKKRRRNEKEKNITTKLDIISDMDITRSIDSPKQLAQLLCLHMEEDICSRTITIPSKQGDCNEKTSTICSDVRTDRAGLICIVTKWRAVQLRNSGKLPCPSCIKWCKGEKGLWWHQQMDHGNTHAVASSMAASQLDNLAVILYEADKNFRFPSQSKTTSFSLQGRTKLVDSIDEFDLIKNGFSTEFKRAVTNGFSPFTLDKNGAAPLHWAAGQGHSDLVQFLIEECDTPADMPQKGKRSFSGRTPLQWSARNGHINVTKYLVEKQKVNIDATTIDGTTAFCWACWQGHLDIMRFLFSQGCNIHKKNSFGCNAVLWCAQGSGSLEAIQFLQSIKGDFTTINSNGHGVAHKAAQRGNSIFFQTINEIISSKTALHLFAPDSEGCCPSDLAGMEGHEDLAVSLSKTEISIALEFHKMINNSTRQDNEKRSVKTSSTDECQDYPKWLKLGIKNIKEAQTLSLRQIESVWESQGGARRMSWFIKDYMDEKKLR